MNLILILLLALIAANLTWFSEKFLFFMALKTKKPLKIRLLEIIFMYLIIGALAMGFEFKTAGQLHPQSWEFYVITFCLFIVFSLPGFLYTFLFKSILLKHKI
ncbi:MAG: DUF2818 family protein [Gammaproteobacteria bacterium]|nr:DUF2818 family protein [Gammaproteobacteria bacterium]